MTATPLIVSLQSVTYSYGRDQAAISVLAGVDLEVREGVAMTATFHSRGRQEALARQVEAAPSTP